MAERIEPALTAEDREDIERYGAASEVEGWAFGDDWPKVIAAANAALPDSDPRKITRETVAMLRQYDKALKMFANASGNPLPDDGLAPLADALESYLPPTDA